MKDILMIETKKVKTGKILYAYLNVNNQKIKLYRFGKKMIMTFTMREVEVLGKALIRTPINGARLSSPFVESILFRIYKTS